MAVFEEISYGMVCDICNKLYISGDSGCTLFTEKSFAIEEAEKDSWKVLPDEKCYCPDCYEILMMKIKK